MSTGRATISPGPRLSHRRYGARAAAAAVSAVGLALVFPGVSEAAQAPIGLGTAGSFVVLAGQGITNANATTIIGDVGTFPNPAETGFDTVSLTGTNHHDDAVTQGAKDDVVTAYNEAAGAGPPTSVAVELGGTTLKPGVYSGTTLEITGTLTLDTRGDPNAVFVLQSGSTLITAANSAVTVLNGGTACNVFWKVPSSATLGTDSHLIGTVLASASIQATSGATVQGRLLAQTASVTLDHITITNAGCAPSTSTGGSGGTTTTTSGGSVTTTTLGGPSTGIPAQSVTGASGQSALGSSGTTATSIALTTATSDTATASTTRPPLANTGFHDELALLGVTLTAVGVIVLRLSKGGRGRATG